MFNNGNFGMMNNIPQGTGYNFNGMQPQQMVKVNNVLSAEEIQRLMQKENQFTLNVTETEALRAKCSHRTPDGTADTITEDPATGICECYICHYRFKPLDPNTSVEVLQESVDNIIDILQTIKLLYINMSPEAQAEFFMIIPLIEKIPKLFEFACKDYSKHANFNAYSYNNRNMSTMNLFNAVMGSFAGAGMPMYQPQQMNGYQQPMMGGAAPQQFYMGQQQPMMNPAMGQPMMTNGFGYMGTQPVADQTAYQPATNGYSYQPQQQTQQPVQPVTAPAIPGTTTPAETAATTDGKEVNVTSTFKA